MTDVLIKRELLERLALPPASSSGWTEWNTAVAYEAARELRALLAEQPQADHSVNQPQGVAGQDQVLAYLWQTNIHTVPDLTRSRPEPGIHGLKFVKELVDRAAVLPTIPDGWVESLSRALVVEIERAIKQRDKFFETGVSTASHGGSHDTCFELIVRQHIACLNATHQDQSSEVRRLREALPYLRNAVAEASASGVAQLAVVSTKPDGSGELVCKFECAEFMADLAAVVRAGSQTEDDDAIAEALKFLQRNGIASTGQEV